MLRGSRPGKRRGGRTRGTPNRRTILRDRILSIGLEHPAASQRVFLTKLVKDRKLPADTRMAVAPQSFPPKRRRSARTGHRPALAGIPTSIAQEALAAEGAVASKGSQTFAVVAAIRDWSPQALDALFGVVQDATANPQVRRKAALKIADFLLPKVAKKPKVIPDEYGFSISPNLASGYRDIQRELWALVSKPTRKIPAIADKIKKLEARSDAIRRRLQVPCPTKYGNKEAANDCDRLMEFAALREDGTALTEVQTAEEAHLRARFDVFAASPESIARRRRQALEDAERRFKKSRLFGDFPAALLSRQDRNDLRLLRWLYPKPARNLSQLDGDGGDEVYRNHPFTDELLAANGNFYPPHSKLRPAASFRKGMVYLEGPKARIYELEKRRVAEDLTPTEEEELQDLRQRHPRIAEVVSQMNLVYDYWFDREFKRVEKASPDIAAAIRWAEDTCLRFVNPPGRFSNYDLYQLRDDGTWPWDFPASSPVDTATSSGNEPKPTK
jgi:hypothetical protein